MSSIFKFNRNNTQNAQPWSVRAVGRRHRDSLWMQSKLGATELSVIDISFADTIHQS